MRNRAKTCHFTVTFLPLYRYLLSVKMLTSDGTVLIKSTRSRSAPSPPYPAFRPWIPNGIGAIGNYETYQIVITYTLKSGLTFRYWYGSYSEDAVNAIQDTLNNAAGSAQSGLTGGEFYNPGVRPLCTRKQPYTP